MTVSKLEMIALGLLLLLGGFFRLYHLRETAMFLGDQGRDAIIAKDIIKNGDIALIGPVTSVGNMYLGPFYYYFMVPWLAISYPDPIGPAVGVALVGILTIPMVYFMTKKMFSASGAFIATTLFVCSSIAIDQVRFSWNPNIAPTVGLLIFYVAYRLTIEKKYHLITWLGVLFAIIIQLHYMALLLGLFIALPVISLFVSEKKDRGKIVGRSLLAILIVVLSTLPLVIFDARHDHLISRSFAEFFSSNQEHVLPTSKVAKVITSFSGNFYKLIPQMLESTTQKSHKIITFILLFLTLLAYKKSDQNQKKAIRLAGLWLGVTALLASFYASSIFTHYLSFSQAVSFLIIGGIAGIVFEKYKLIAKTVIIVGLLMFVIKSPQKSVAFMQGQSHIDKAKTTSQSIVDRVGEGEKYNVVLISGTGDIDAQSYRYFLEVSDKPPVKKEARGEVETLFIIQEDYFNTKVVDSPIYEIVVFPDKTPKEVYTIENGPTITKLTK
jgi:hypothetical protein